MSITHLYVSAVADDANPNLVRPSEWNDDHDLSTFDASQVPYDNATSGVSGTDVQAAIDELAAVNAIYVYDTLI